MPLLSFGPIANRIAAACCAAMACAAALAQEAPPAARPASAPAAAGCPPTATTLTTEQLRAGMSAARDHGFLWRISKGDHSSYLYGTVHVAKLEWDFPGATLQQALQASDTLALELDPLSPDIRRRLAEGLAAQKHTALPEALQQRLAAQAAADCVPIEALAALAPEMQIVTLSSLVGRRDGLDPAYGIDIFLAGWGHAAKKTVVSLETPELQLAALHLENSDEAVAFVDSTLTELESGRAASALRRIAQVWADGDLPSLMDYERWCDCVNTPADRLAIKRLLDDRNPALADAVAALHEGGGRVFAAVGSLHMIGPLGLPALLTQRGYRVEQVVFAH